jgi:aldehyde:ferredoxin oxidoreductase
MLSGTAAVNTGRFSAGAKSPLTGTIKESNVGGLAAQMFARLGIKALIIEGIPPGDEWFGLSAEYPRIAFGTQRQSICSNPGSSPT